MSKATKLLEKVSKRLDLPADVTAGAPRTTLTGFGECSIEGECAILEYEKTQITVSVTGGTVTIRGAGLEVRIMAEIIREKLLWNLEKEIPHGTAVEITKFSERDDGIIDLDATIYCEKASHKGIIIGKNGQMLKKISTMQDKTGCVIYVGKAKKLKNRVSQYFQDSSAHTPKTRRMVSQIDHFDVIVAGSEFEALVLECSLIKRHMEGKIRQPHRRAAEKARRLLRLEPQPVHNGRGLLEGRARGVLHAL